MPKPKPKPLKPRSIKFTKEQERHIRKMSVAQGHHHFSQVVKRLVDRDIREMQAH